MSHGYYRYPTISGDRIVFVCEDDLWSAPAAGGTAVRLSVSAGQCSTPRLSPDGRWIAYIANDEGNPELYVMSAEGGAAQRLTFLGGSLAAVSTWDPDSKRIYFVSNVKAWYERETAGYTIGREEPLTPLGLGHMKSLSLGPKRALVVGRNADDCARWKRYRGGTAGEIWIDRNGNGTFARLLSGRANPVWPMWIGQRIYFLDDRDGIGNIHSCDLKGGDIRRHTDEREYYARFPSTDGKRIIYSAGGDIKVLDVASDKVTTIEIATPSPAPETVRRFVQAAEEFEHFAPQPDGTGLALVSRGQPFTMPYWEDAVLHHGTGSQTRYRLTEWTADGKHVMCVTDRNGFEQLELHAADGTDKPKLLTDKDIGRVTDLACSPVDDDVVAVCNHRHELLIIDAKSGAVRTLDKSPSNRVTDISFSPDGRFLAYCWWPAIDTSIIRIVKIKSGRVHDATAPMRTDYSPAWDPEGNYLFFISTRDFNPVYDALQFDLSFPQAARPYVVTLRKDVPSPFIPKPRPIHRDHEAHADGAEADKKAKKPVHIEIDFDGITGRVIGFPIDEGQYGQIVAARKRVLFTKFEVRGLEPAPHVWTDDDEAGTLLAYDFEQLRCATLARDVSDVRLAADHRTLLYRSHDRLRAVDALAELPEEGDEQPKPAAEPGRKSGWIDLERVGVEVEPAKEWSQMYREAWRLQREQFWVEDMSEVDWNHVLERYERVLPYIRTRAELSDLIWEMQGELGTSHAYEFGGDWRQPPHYAQGFLGADFEWDKRAHGYRIERILRGDSWNRQIDSPLAEPGVDVREGDVLVAINGKELSRDYGPDQALVNLADREAVVSFKNGKTSDRRFAVKTLADERRLRYRAWVEANRRKVHELTGERIGYIHIPDMGPWGFSEFHRGFLSEFNRDGLIVDVRYNRGGHVSPLLLGKLLRKRVGYDVMRYAPTQPYPPESIAGPIVAITNQFAGSDGDIFSHCFKLYGIGPLIGKRTWGGVVGINPYHRLVDGTITTQPEASFWFYDVGWGIENYGTDPDYDVDVAPHDYRDGKDPQMERAIELVLDLAKRNQQAKPDVKTRPSLRLPGRG
ncbi:MAG: PDZ domain-containing protein [Candidatus Eremiobacteraeota bacterium]|nr:PDZ domain-containing protein [Candidatus Eremiobacteraeota bacterium]